MNNLEEENILFQILSYNYLGDELLLKLQKKEILNLSLINLKIAKLISNFISNNFVFEYVPSKSPTKFKYYPKIYKIFNNM